MHHRDLFVLKQNVVIYEGKLPYILVDSTWSIIVRIPIPVTVYNKCRDSIEGGDYIDGTSVSKVMHIRGIFAEYINAALEQLNLKTDYMPGNIIGITTGDNAVFSNEIYVVDPSAVVNSSAKNMTVRDEGVQHVRYIDYIVPIDREKTSQLLDTALNSIKFESSL
jgi:hypothetical protein